jgi:PTH1 family peptidyl-tRNA hydrolase
MWTIVGLGNPGKEYENTRHNTGRIVLRHFLKAFDLGEPASLKKHQGLVTEGKIGKEAITVLFPETFMNKSGASVGTMVKSIKKAQQLIVVYDDLDLPLGTIKISFNRSSGGHRGLLSIIKHLKTEAFIRIRVGISPTTPSGKLKKPKGEIAVDKFIIGWFKPSEEAELKKVSKKVTNIIETIIVYSLERAMSEFN